MRKFFTAALSVASVLSFCAGAKADNNITYKITLTNVTHGIILTPPIFSLSKHKTNIFKLGEPASLGLEMAAEGGATDELRAELEDKGVQDVVQTDSPVPPGVTITVMLSGNRASKLNLASMLLPTNDGFIAMNGKRVFNKARKRTFYLRAFDAGTEENDEICANIPGPQCGGEGFNDAGGEGFVVAHAGIHGESELSGQAYNWGNPVAIVTVQIVRDGDREDNEEDDD